MFEPPSEFLPILTLFAEVFSAPVWRNAQFLFLGAILARESRTITAILRILGASQEPKFHKFHWALSNAKWSALKAGKILFNLINQIVPFDKDLVIALDETLQKRNGIMLKKLGFYMKSSKKEKGLTFGLKWLCAAVIVKFPWSKRSWALPVLLALTQPRKVLESSRNKFDQKRKEKNRYKPFTKYTIQIIQLLAKWSLGIRSLIFVADGAFNTFEIAFTCIKAGCAFISRLRWDAGLYDFPPEPIGKKGRPRIKGKRLPKPSELLETPKKKWKKGRVLWYGGEEKEVLYLTGKCLWYRSGSPVIPIQWIIVKDPEGKFEPAILSCTDLNMPILKIIGIFVSRFNIEVTFEEIRAHLGFETLRNWSDKAIDRTTPVIAALYSLVSLFALRIWETNQGELVPNTTAWYHKAHVTFSDALIAVRRRLLHQKYFSSSRYKPESEKNPSEELVSELLDLLLVA